MQVIRVISYETDDADRLARQLGNSLRDGHYPEWHTKITIGTVSDDQELLRRLERFLEPFKAVSGGTITEAEVTGGEAA